MFASQGRGGSSGVAEGETVQIAILSEMKELGPRVVDIAATDESDLEAILTVRGEGHRVCQIEREVASDVHGQAIGYP